MKTITYKNKIIKLPFPSADYGDEPLKEIEVANRFNGDKTTLPAFAVAVYDVIMGSEMLQDWKSHRLGLDWFIKYFPKQYMVLLD